MSYNPNTTGGTTTNPIYNYPPTPQPCQTCGRCPACGNYKPSIFIPTMTTACSSIDSTTNTTTAKVPFTYTQQ